MSLPGDPVVRLRSFFVRLGVPVVMLFAAAGCAGGPTAADEALPMEFQIRSDVPYIRGEIVERTVSASGELRLHVRALPGAESRNSEALVTVLPEAIIRWANGKHGTREQLRRGQVVTVWVTGPELRSMPPQVGANGLILHRVLWP